MIKARIIPAKKSVTQSGHTKKSDWMIEFVGSVGVARDNEAAWNATSDTFRQINLYFSSLDDAKQYAEKHHLNYTIENKNEANPRRRSYAENFKHG